jgi:hypothetical protein
METVKTVDKLTADRANILTQDYENGEQVGLNHRCSYSNSESGRALLVANEPEDIVTEVMAVWGDSPTVEEPEMPEFEAKPTPEERIAELEAETATLKEYDTELLYQVCLLQLGITEEEMM